MPASHSSLCKLHCSVLRFIEKMSGLKFRSLKYASIMINYTTALALMISNIKINDGSKKNAC